MLLFWLFIIELGYVCVVVFIDRGVGNRVVREFFYRDLLCFFFYIVLRFLCFRYVWRRFW